jgi:hypothetical protein
VIHCDNQSCIRLSSNLVFHDRSKHIDIRYCFIQDCVQRGVMRCVQRGVMRLDYIQTDEKMVDIFTKALSIQKFMKFRD